MPSVTITIKKLNSIHPPIILNVQLLAWLLRVHLLFLRLLYSVPSSSALFHFVDKQVITVYKKMGFTGSLEGTGSLTKDFHAYAQGWLKRTGFETMGFTRIPACSWPILIDCVLNHNAYLIMLAAQKLAFSWAVAVLVGRVFFRGGGWGGVGVKIAWFLWL